MNLYFNKKEIVMLKLDKDNDYVYMYFINSMLLGGNSDILLFMYFINSMLLSGNSDILLFC